MPTSILPIAAIRALRLTCRHGGAAVVIPLTARHRPAQCCNSAMLRADLAAGHAP